jgi:copper(I)-binding protein
MNIPENDGSCWITRTIAAFSRRTMTESVIVATVAIRCACPARHPSPPWVREAAKGAPGTYSCIIEIQNDGDEPERLLGATIEGAGTGVLYKLTENNGHFTSRPFEEGLVIKPHGSIELPPTAYQFKFGKITKAICRASLANSRLSYESAFSRMYTAPENAGLRAEINREHLAASMAAVNG